MDLHNALIKYMTEVRHQYLVVATESAKPEDQDECLRRAQVLGEAIRILQDADPSRAEPDLPPIVRLMVEEILEQDPDAEVRIVHVSGH